jgi:hypothetical protein
MRPRKHLTLGGRRYRLSVRPFDGLVEARGGLLAGEVVLTVGVGLDSPRLRDHLAEAVEEHLAAVRAAGPVE